LSGRRQLVVEDFEVLLSSVGYSQDLSPCRDNVDIASRNERAKEATTQLKQLIQ